MVNPLRTRVTNGKHVDLILPNEMNGKDYELLIRWIELLCQGDTYDDGNEITETTVSSVTEEIKSRKQISSETVTHQRKPRIELVPMREEIMSLWKSGVSIQQIADKFGASYYGVADLINREKFTKSQPPQQPIEKKQVRSVGRSSPYMPDDSNDLLKLLHNNAVIELREVGRDQYFTVNGVRVKGYSQIQAAIHQLRDQVNLTQIRQGGIVYRLELAEVIELDESK